MEVFRDIRFGLRAMRGNLLLTIVAAMALAVGIGLNTTAFGLVNAVLIKGLPFEDGHEIVHLNSTGPNGGMQGVSYPDLEDWRERARSFDGLAAFGGATVNLSDDERFPENVNGTRVDTNVFDVVRQPVLIGRNFTPEDGLADATRVALIGEDVWERRFGRDPGIIGTTIRANAFPYEIIGVMPRGMEFPNNSEFWFPIREDPSLEERPNRGFQVVGRLADGVSMSEAEAEMGTIAASLAGGIRLFDLAVAPIEGKPYWIDFSMDYRVLGYLLLVSVGTALFFGLVPAIRASRSDIQSVLKDGGRGTSAGSSTRRWIGALVVAEIGLTLVLLVGAGVMLRSFLNLQRIDLGVDTETIMTGRVLMSVADYEEESDRIAFQDRLLENLGRTAGIERATLASHAPGMGATSRHILWLVARASIRQLVIGVVLGALGAFAMTRVLGSFMFGVGTSDPLTFAAVVVTLALVAAAASIVPARRAMQLDPLDALRE